MIRRISIGFLIRRRGITTTVPGISRGNATITTCRSCNHVIVEINAIAGKFVLREILLEIVGVQINVTVRHFTYTDAHCTRIGARRERPGFSDIQ